MIRFLSGRTYRVPVRRGITIREFSREIQKVSNTMEDRVALLIKGVVLDEDKTVDDYEITDSTAITAVNTKNKEKEELKRKEKEVEDYLISLCHRIGKQKKSVEKKPQDSKTMQDMMELTTKTFHYSFAMSVEELVPIVLSNNDLYKKIVNIPFFQTVIKDRRLLRCVLYNNPVFMKLMERNPGIKPILDEDEFFQKVVSVMLSEDEDIIAKRKHVATMLEERLGEKLQFPDDLVQYVPPVLSSDSTTSTTKSSSTSSSTSSKPSTPSTPSIPSTPSTHTTPKRQRTTPLFHFTEDQKEAFITAIQSKPDIIVNFLKGTPIYRLLIHKNPELIKEIMSPERLQIIFSSDTISRIIDLNQTIHEDVESKRRKTQ